MTRDDELPRQLAEDYTTAPIEPRQRAMLHYAVKLTREPWSVRKDDVVVLRAAGFSDRDIHDINQVTAYFAYVNRVADGLGVGLDAYVADEP